MMRRGAAPHSMPACDRHKWVELTRRSVFVPSLDRLRYFTSVAVVLNMVLARTYRFNQDSYKGSCPGHAAAADVVVVVVVAVVVGVGVIFLVIDMYMNIVSVTVFVVVLLLLSWFLLLFL